MIKGPGSRGLRREGSIFAFALDGAEPRARVVQGGGYDVVVGNRENALRDGKVAIEELEAIKMHAGIALKPLAVQGTSHHVKSAPQLFSDTIG